MRVSPPLPLFQGFGVELEYMIVDGETLSALPITDQVIHAVVGSYESEIEVDALCWSNELVLHVIELKTNGPANRLEGLAGVFSDHVREINRLLKPLGARLMPTGMHPWFDPGSETQLWPHEYSPVYEAYNRIFNCQGHGWSNLQSIHLNLPFLDDAEFGALHAAIRLVLPIMPALAASTPLIELRLTGLLDNRLDVYRSNAATVPSIAGRVIPEPAYTRSEYDRVILQPMYRDIAPKDPEGVLQDEFLNSRGAIARFVRNTIEIRVLDIQECPQADLAVVALIVAALKALIAGRWISLDRLKAWPTDPLADIFFATVADGEATLLTNRDYLKAFGIDGVKRCRAGELWRHIADAVLPAGDPATTEFQAPLQVILGEGTLARRILRALDGDASKPRVARLYRELCDCLAAGRMFHAAD